MGPANTDDDLIILSKSDSNLSPVLGLCSGFFTRCMASRLQEIVWYGLTGYMYCEGELGILLMSMTYYPQMFINYAINGTLRRFEKVHDLSVESTFNPGLESQLAASFSVFFLSMALFRRRLPRIINLFLLIVFPLYILISMGRECSKCVKHPGSQWDSVWQGVMLGSTFGFLMAIHTNFYQSRWIRRILGLGLVKAFGYKETRFGFVDDVSPKGEGMEPKHSIDRPTYEKLSIGINIKVI